MICMQYQCDCHPFFPSCFPFNLKTKWKWRWCHAIIPRVVSSISCQSCYSEPETRENHQSTWNYIKIESFIRLPYPSFCHDKIQWKNHNRKDIRGVHEREASFVTISLKKTLLFSCLTHYFWEKGVTKILFNQWWQVKESYIFLLKRFPYSVSDKTKWDAHVCQAWTTLRSTPDDVNIIFSHSWHTNR